MAHMAMHLPYAAAPVQSIFLPTQRSRVCVPVALQRHHKTHFFEILMDNPFGVFQPGPGTKQPDGAVPCLLAIATRGSADVQGMQC